ncbi:MAG: hypothetical protein HDR90_03615 [Bacteroides sp.]|nr:hypothetical protein [Bacteroides sp.]
MGLFSKKKEETKPKAPKKQVIKVNPYENPQNVLDLMARISSAKASTDTSIYWQILNDAYTKKVKDKCLEDYLEENRRNLSNFDFEHQLIQLCSNILYTISDSKNTEHTQVVVAGGFSSGKSSFLNRITNSVNLLPTGTEPVSVVKTYLYCSNSCNGVTVKGVNHKDVVVHLTPWVLQAIQHASASNIHLASVLSKLYVEVNADRLNGVVFIDTPGYNNKDVANDSNGKTDRETAKEAMDEGNVLFWFVNIDRGTIVKEDIEMMKPFKGPKLIFFNKADKLVSHGKLNEVKRIVDTAAAQLYQVFPKEEILDIIAYSALDGKVYYSYNNRSQNIIDHVRSVGTGLSELNFLKNRVSELFDNEIQASEQTINDIKESYKEKSDKRDEYNNIVRSLNIAKDDTISYELKELLIQSYNNICKEWENLYKAGDECLNAFSDFYDEVYHWDKTDHNAVWDNTLTPILRRGANSKNRSAKKLEDCNTDYYNEEYRIDLWKRVNNLIATGYEMIRDEYADSCSNLMEQKHFEENMIQSFKEYKQLFMAALDLAIHEYKKRLSGVNYKSETAEIPDVFESIEKADFNAFIRSFENGVDISVSNSKGFNPFTYAVNYGYNDMVKFLLDHGADPSIKDARGYNAFHTAVENEYRDLAEMLLANDPDLIDMTTDKGETVEDLANKHTFMNWLSKKL